MGPIGRLVGVDAFSQALTNPLLSHQVFRPDTFSDAGWATIQSTKHFADIVDRNCLSIGRPHRVSMSLPGQSVG